MRVRKRRVAVDLDTLDGESRGGKAVGDQLLNRLFVPEGARLAHERRDERWQLSDALPERTGDRVVERMGADGRHHGS